MNRETATQKILEAKREKGLTFEAIASKVGKHKVWTTAALHGQHPMSAEEADAVCSLLGL
ncbi:MAG: cyanate hydratase, partial [Rubrobacter sp.]|nr:cyanate hydratase [Rubrobacter sp.]MBA2376618.1 cyanate hydratase [Rubrobacter sp.]